MDTKVFAANAPKAKTLFSIYRHTDSNKWKGEMKHLCNVCYCRKVHKGDLYYEKNFTSRLLLLRWKDGTLELVAVFQRQLFDKVNPNKYFKVDLCVKIKRGVILLLEIDENSHNSNIKEDKDSRARSVTDHSGVICIIWYSVPQVNGETPLQRSIGEKVETVIFEWMRKLDEVDIGNMPTRWFGVHYVNYQRINKHVFHVKKEDRYSWIEVSQTDDPNLL